MPSARTNIQPPSSVGVSVPEVDERFDIVSRSPSASVVPANKASTEIIRTWQPTRSCNCTGPLVRGARLRMGSGMTRRGSGSRCDGLSRPPPPPPPPPPPAPFSPELDGTEERLSLPARVGSPTGPVATRTENEGAASITEEPLVRLLSLSYAIWIGTTLSDDPGLQSADFAATLS